MRLGLHFFGQTKWAAPKPQICIGMVITQFQRLQLWQHAQSALPQWRGGKDLGPTEPHAK